MQLPTIPTDSLYKFMSISGIIVMLFFFSISIYSIYQIQNKITEEKKNVSILEAKTKILKRLSDNHESYIQELLKLVEEKEITKREFYELQKQEILRFNEYSNPIEIDLAISGSNIKSLDISINYVYAILLVSIILSFRSLYFTRKSFKLWYEKLQVHQDKQIKDLSSNKIIYKKRI
ncbi:hypothetical protein N5U05_11590 [Aliarcobacter butzleri]|uniref:hypothetical protein n=1 Tax=Aliarcobacter butzleri TaxID=28197 RepID=UPI0021B1D8A0|nr:hypothetical protein [Aliarcobacter butzleri]MCT7618381.1 hypothetical protein [Aliarcobacter butzleri]